MFGGLLTMSPLRPSAQAVGRIYRIGYLGVNPPVSTSFIEEMARRGYVEGRNLVIERRFGGGNPERLQAFAEELVAQRVDLIVSGSGTPGVRATKRATQAIPIVMTTSADPVSDGFIASLARPGGNITGNSIQGLDLWLKRMELLSEAAGKPKRFGYLLHGSVRTLAHADSWGKILRDRARLLDAEIRSVYADSVNDLETAFDGMRRDGIDAVMIDNFFFPSNITAVTEVLARYRLPAVAEGRAFADRGVLIAYGVDYAVLNRRAAAYVDQILKGASPGEIPVQQADKFELFVNLKTARGLGLTIPQSLLQRADDVIQ